MEMDMISGLPNSIMQHILCFLSQKEATRTCVLSKSWRHHWSTRPVLDFRESFFRGDNRTLLSVLDNTLQRYHHQNLSVERFRVEVSDFIYVFLIDLFNKRNPVFLINMGVEALHLIYPQSDSVVFRAQRLTALYLVGCKIMFCPEWHFTRLKSVRLVNVLLPNESFSCFSSNFPCLQELEVRSCLGFNQVKLFNPSIRRLVILENLRAITITIDAPNILYFEFLCGISLPSVFSFTTSTSASSREWKSRVSLPFKPRSSKKDVSEWFLKLNELLKALRESRITLSLSNHQHFIDTSRVGLHEPVELEHLSLKDFFSSDSFAALFDGLFRVFRPRCIDMGLFSIRKSENNQLAEFICKAHLEEGGFSRVYFWHRDLKKFSFEIFNEHSKEWCCVQGSSLTESQFRQDIRFRFEWR